jgi:hypothetical protein
MAQSADTSAPTWHRLAQLSDRLREQWARSNDRTRWAACGQAWDAVAIAPISRGLDALAALRISPRRGYPVLADYVSNQLYVMVPPGTGGAAAGLPGVRVLSVGHQLLLPDTPFGTAAAHWVSPPRGTSPVLVRPDRLSHHLRALADQPKADSA